MTDFIRAEIARRDAAYRLMVARASAVYSSCRNAEILSERIQDSAIGREEIRIGNSLDRIEGAL